MGNRSKKTLVAAFAALGLFWPLAYAEDAHGHDHDDDHDHEHHIEYLADGAIDIALVYHAEDGELEFTLFAGEDHGHDQSLGEDHDGDHGEDGDHEHGDDPGDEHDHGDDGDHGGDDHDHGDEHGAGIHLEDAVILGGANTKFILPQGGGFDFLGEAGDEFYRLPQDAAAGPAAPGFAMEFEDGIFTDDEASVTLTGVEGPGDLVAFILGGFGDVTIVFDSRDGLDASDVFTGLGETHQHLNWAFTEPGIYHLDLEGHAELAVDSAVLTASGELTFQVGSGAAYLREIEDYRNGFAATGNLGEVYADSFPWLHIPLLKGWTFAAGEGGEEMFLFVSALNSWMFTGSEIAPWFYDFGRGSWIYVLGSPGGTIYLYDASTRSWSLMPEDSTL